MVDAEEKKKMNGKSLQASTSGNALSLIVSNRPTLIRSCYELQLLVCQTRRNQSR